MGLITLLPLGAIRLAEGIWVIYSIFWIYPIPMIAYLWLIIPLYIFSILYIRQIARFFNGDSSRDSALMCGLISILLPTLVGIVISVLLGYPYSSYLYVYPIPIQFLVGLVFLYRFREPENISPWSGQYIDWSWWVRLKAKWSNWTADVIELYFDEEEAVMSMKPNEADEYFNEVSNSEGTIICQKCAKKIKPIFLCEVCETCLDCCVCGSDD
jgi:hypothetical protein